MVKSFLLDEDNLGSNQNALNFFIFLLAEFVSCEVYIDVFSFVRKTWMRVWTCTSIHSACSIESRSGR